MYNIKKIPKSQILGFQISLISHLPLSINSLHSNLHLSSFQRCLLLQTLASSLHLNLNVSFHSIYLASLAFDNRLNSLTFMHLTTREIHNFAYG